MQYINYIYIDYIYIYNKIVIKAVEPAKDILKQINAREEITLLKVITYGLQTYSVEMEAGIVHAYKLILGLVEVGICR